MDSLTRERDNLLAQVHTNRSKEVQTEAKVALWLQESTLLKSEVEQFQKDKEDLLQQLQEMTDLCRQFQKQLTTLQEEVPVAFSFLFNSNRNSKVNKGTVKRSLCYEQTHC